MKKALIISALMLMTSLAQAKEVWNCSVSFNAQGAGLQLIVGQFKLSGQGTAVCQNQDGEIKEFPLEVAMGGEKIAPSLSFGFFKIRGQGEILGINDSVENIYGKYLTVGADASALIGLGVSTGIEMTNASDLKFNLNLQTIKGLGVSVGLRVLKLMPAKAEPTVIDLM